MPSVFFSFLINLTGGNSSNKNVGHPVFYRAGTVIYSAINETKSLRFMHILGIFAKIFHRRN